MSALGTDMDRGHIIMGRRPIIGRVIMFHPTTMGIHTITARATSRPSSVSALPSASESAGRPGIQLLAGPPPANPPIFIAAIIVVLSLVAPILFLKTGAPGPLLGIAALALAVAGIVTASAAVKARLQRQSDLAVRPRVTVNADGITLHRKPAPAPAEFFPFDHIDEARLLAGTLILRINTANPAPGRHILRFGGPVSNRELLLAALVKPN